MGVTISTHNGSKVARDHNIRNPKVVSKEPHIDLHGCHEIWIDEKPKTAYQRLFGSAVEDYNAKQSRSDRLITDYYKKICDDKKKHPVYEMIVAIGNIKDFTYEEVDNYDYVGETELTEQAVKPILRDFVDGWQKRNPQLELIGAYYHADEQGVPHVHLDYIPIAYGYKKGLHTQSALVKALEQQGFDKNGRETAQIQWERRENAHLEQLCLNRGIEVRHPLIEGRKHLDTERYKAEQTIDELSQEIDNSNVILSETFFINEQTKEENRELRSEQERLQAKVDELKAEIKGKLADVEKIKTLIKESEKLVKGRKQLEEKLTVLRSEQSTLEKEVETLTVSVQELREKKKDLDNHIIECRKTVVDIEKAENRTPKTAEQWLIALGAEKRKIGSGYIVPDYKIESLARKMAEFDKKIKVLSAEVKNLTYENQQLELGYISPFKQVEQKMERDKLKSQLRAYQSVVESLPVELRETIKTAIKVAQNENNSPRRSSYDIER